MPKFPRSVLNVAQSYAAQESDPQKAMMGVSVYLARKNSEDPRYGELAKSFTTQGDIGDPAVAAKVFQRILNVANTPELIDEDEPKGLYPPSQASLNQRYMDEAPALTTGLAKSAAPYVAGAFVPGLAEGAVMKTVLGIAAPTVVSSIMAGSETGSPKVAAEVGAGTAIPMVLEEAVQRGLEARGIPGSLTKMAMHAGVSGINTLMSMYHQGMDLKSPEAVAALAAALAGGSVRGMQPTPQPQVNPHPEIGPEAPRFAAPEGSQDAENLRAFASSAIPGTSDVLKNQANFENVFQNIRRGNYVGELRDPRSQQSLGLLTQLRTGAETELGAVETQNRDLQALQEGMRREQLLTADLEWQQQQKLREAQRQEQLLNADAEWAAQQEAAKRQQQEATQAVGARQIEALNTLAPTEPTIPVQNIQEAATGINKPTIIDRPVADINPQLPPGTPRTHEELGNRINSEAEVAKAKLREVSEGIYKDAYRNAENIDRFSEEPVFNQNSHRDFQQSLQGAANRFRTVLASAQGQAGPAFPKLQEIARLVDEFAATGETGVVGLAPLMRVIKEVNQSLPWKGGHIDLAGEPLAAVTALKTILENKLQNAWREAPEAIQGDVRATVETYNKGRDVWGNIPRIAFRQSRMPGSQQTPVDITLGGKPKVVKALENPVTMGKGVLTNPNAPVKVRRLQNALSRGYASMDMSPTNAGKIARIINDFETQDTVKQVGEIVKPGTEATPETAAKLEALKAGKKDSHQLLIEQARQGVLEMMNTNNVDPQVTTEVLFAPPSPDRSGARVSQWPQVKQILDALPPQKRDNTWAAILQHQLDQLGVGKKDVVNPGDFGTILADPIYQNAPPHLLQTIRDLSEMRLPEMLSPGSTKPSSRPMSPVPGPTKPSSRPMSAVPAPQVQPETNPRLLRGLRELASWDQMTPLLMKNIEAGVEYGGVEFVHYLRRNLGEEGTRQFAENYLNHISTDAEGEFEPKGMFRTLNSLPHEVTDNFLFNGRGHTQQVLQALEHIEMPTKGNIDAILGRYPERTDVATRRPLSHKQAFESTLKGAAAGAAAGVGAKTLPLAVSGALGVTATGLALWLSVIHPRSVVARAVGNPTDFARIMGVVHDLNQRSGGTLARTGANVVGMNVRDEYERKRKQALNER